MKTKHWSGLEFEMELFWWRDPFNSHHSGEFHSHRITLKLKSIKVKEEGSQQYRKATQHFWGGLPFNKLWYCSGISCEKQAYSTVSLVQYCNAGQHRWQNWLSRIDDDTVHDSWISSEIKLMKCWLTLLSAVWCKSVLRMYIMSYSIIFMSNELLNMHAVIMKVYVVLQKAWQIWFYQVSELQSHCNHKRKIVPMKCSMAIILHSMVKDCVVQQTCRLCMISNVYTMI